MAGAFSTNAQDGTCKVSESWSVTVYDPYDNVVVHKTGKESGTINISGGSYQLINDTGAADVGSLDGSIQYDGNQYTVNAQPVLYAFATKGTGLYAVVKLSFFVVLVPLPSTFGFSLFQEDDVYTATGISPSDLQGSGTAVDGNDEEWDMSSTASLTVPAVAPSITTPPISEVVMAGSDVSFSVGASGTTPFTYEWEHDGTKLSNSGEFSGTTTATLNINNAQSKDAGSYTVVVSNSKGSASVSATLTVYTAQTYTNLYSFSGGSDGSHPSAEVVLSGNTLYGTAFKGGASSNGTVFAVNTDGTGFTNLHSFTEMFTNSMGIYTNSDGAWPGAGLVLSGNTLYGTASGGGASGYGTVFAVNTDGTGFTTLYSFTNGSDGAYPYAGLVLSGNILYGTASEGGTNGYGTVFAVNTDGTGFTTVYSFTDGSDGADPYAGLVLSGNTLYGTASGGGASGYGTVFAVNTNGTGFTTLYSFTNGSDGSMPSAGLVLSGNTLYGTAFLGGSSDNGTVFAIKTDGTGFTILHGFTALDTATDTTNSDGAWPGAGLILSGNTLYGTTIEGGRYDGGTVFAIKTDGTDFTTLYNFTGGSDGAAPSAGLILSGNTLYGTAYDGGTDGHGAVFSLYVGAPSATQGSLQVTITPPGAVSAGAEWQVDAGVYQKSAATVTNLSAGAHTVSFKTVSGWTSPSNQTATLIGGQTATLAATYLDATKPTLTITNPIKTGGTWSNPVFTVSGKAGDNVGVANVLVSLNGGDWAAATLSNNGSNWTEQVTLTPGMNTIAAYAVDTGNNDSLTNTVKLDYILSTTLTVSTNGDGTISPAYNGALLQIGNTYSMTAKPAKGFGFVNWTDGLSNVITNSAKLEFVMASNLTFVANFEDITRPTLSITNPSKTGEKWSEAVFTVSGKAGDNVVVSNVLVSLNGGDWASATLLNNGSNWTEQVTLVPGTNTIAACAVDSSGNVSLTNTVKLDYILSAPLTVQIVGGGTLKPDYNGALLAISNSYTMKATAAKGFAFYYWGGGVPMSTNKTLTFTMVSNLTITANFKDVTKPTMPTITFPVAKQNWTNTVITVTGKASDNVGVAGVWVRINDGGWAVAGTSDGFTNWSAALPVIFSTNIVQACAVDAAGNVSVTNVVRFLGVLAPASLSGYAATMKPSVGKQELVVSWDESTWAQVGADNDTNADDYCAGSYEYMQTGPNTATLTNVDIGMMSALGTTNVTTVNLTFTSVTSADCAWSSENDSGSGTMTFSPVSNLVPASLDGKTMTARGSVITFAADGTYNEPPSANNGETPGYGTYTFTQYSPTVAIIELNRTGSDYAGAVAYVEVTFTSSTKINIAQSWYSYPSYDSYPDDWGLATGTIK